MFTWKFYHFWYPSKSRVKIYKYGVYTMVQTNFGANYDWFDFQYDRKLGAIIITVHHYLQMSKVYIYWCRLMNFSIYYYIAWMTAKLDNYCWKNYGGRRGGGGHDIWFFFMKWNTISLLFWCHVLYRVYFTECTLQRVLYRVYFTECTLQSVLYTVYFTEWSLGVQFCSWIGLESNFWSTSTFWKYK